MVGEPESVISALTHFFRNREMQPCEMYGWAGALWRTVASRDTDTQQEALPGPGLGSGRRPVALQARCAPATAARTAGTLGVVRSSRYTQLSEAKSSTTCAAQDGQAKW